MPKLIKSAIASYIPGDPGSPGSPYVAAQPARTVVEPRTTCTSGYATTLYCPPILEGYSGVQCYSIQQFTGAVCTTTNVQVYYHATAEIAAVPARPPTAAQVSYYLNEGWNTSARSIGKLKAAEYFQYTVKLGTRAAFLAVGPEGRDGQLISAFTHGVMVDSSGITVFENGAPGAVLAAGNTPGLTIRIVRLRDGRILYSVGSVFSISAQPLYNPDEALYVYGLLYAGWDEVSYSEFKAGNLLSEPIVTTSGQGVMTVYALAKVTMAGSGVMSAQPVPAVVMSGSGVMTATPTFELLVRPVGGRAGSGMSLPLMFMSASGDFIADDEMILISPMLGTMPLSQQIDLVMFLNSSGELSSSLTLTREQALELMSTLQQSDSFAMLGVYGYSLLSAMMAASLQNAGIGSLPDLDDSSAVWVVNIDTQASSQYDRYSFNSFIKRNGVCYGVAPDGIYRLDGETDAGAQVEALAYLGRLDFATALQKLMPNAYLGASSTGKLKLEVDADGSLYVYETRSSEDGTFKQHRVDLGRGLKANMLGLTVKNKDGADFKLATVDLLQAPGGRRI